MGKLTIVLEKMSNLKDTDGMMVCIRRKDRMRTAITVELVESESIPAKACDDFESTSSDEKLDDASIDEIDEL